MRFLFRVIIYLAVGIPIVEILRYFFSYLNISISGWGNVLLVVIAFIPIFVFIINRSRNTLKRIEKGEYDEAIALIHKNIQGNKYRATLINVDYYNLANIYHRKGDFAKSQEYLERVDQGRIYKNLKGTVAWLLAANLLMQNQNLTQARMFAYEAHKLIPFSLNLLLLAVIEHKLGNVEEADRLTKEYLHSMDNTKTKFGLVIMYVDQQFKNIIEKFFLGYYYFLKGDLPAANPYLQNVSNFHYENYYSIKAKEILGSMNKSDSLESL